MILLLGARGQLGSAFQEIFLEKKIKFLSIDKENFDFRNLDLVYNFLKDIYFKNKIDTIINCVAFNNVDEAENNNEVFVINSYLVEKLIKFSNDFSCNFITYSTDFVFTYDKNFYLSLHDQIKNYGFTENFQTNLKSNYAKSKKLAEDFVLKNISEKNLFYVIRTSSLYYKNNKNNFIKKILSQTKKNNFEEKIDIKVVDDQISSPTNAKDLAEISLELLNKKAVSGLYHFSNENFCSKYDLAKYILEKYCFKDLEKINLIRIKSSDFKNTAERPYFSKLNSDKIKKITNFKIRSWQDALEDFFK